MIKLKIVGYVKELFRQTLSKPHTHTQHPVSYKYVHYSMVDYLGDFLLRQLNEVTLEDNHNPRM
jgi:hypothetical protein